MTGWYTSHQGWRIVSLPFPSSGALHRILRGRNLHAGVPPDRQASGTPWPIDFQFHSQRFAVTPGSSVAALAACVTVLGLAPTGSAGDGQAADEAGSGDECNGTLQTRRQQWVMRCPRVLLDLMIRHELRPAS